MNSTTADSKALLLANLATSWSEEILMLCIIVPIGAIGIVLNLMSLRIFLKKSIRSTSLFKYFIVTTLNSYTVGWLIFSTLFSIAIKQLSAVCVYYNFKMFREEFNSFIKKTLNL